MAVNEDHQMIAVGWLDNRDVNLVSTADTTETVNVLRRVQNEKKEIPAPEVVKKYNKFMGGVDKHDKLRSKFSSDEESYINMYIPQPRGSNINGGMMQTALSNECNFTDFNRLPFEISKHSRTCQVCNYEWRKDKWRGVVICNNHGIRLCTSIHKARKDSDPKLVTKRGTPVTDWSWTADYEESCWKKFHHFYEPKGLFNRKVINISDGTIKFGTVNYSSDLYQKKYAAMGYKSSTKKHINMNKEDHILK
jgi:hypothetical protein